ncbi:MAG: hypothetical protein JNJ55_11005 [Betaproteobacteria bacterium]|nr:hypothetical protein [Betaproteobacteria bacterium]
MSQDANKLLGVVKGASAADVQRAYRKALARLESDTSLTDSERRLANQRLDAAYEELAVPKASSSGGLASPKWAAVMGIAIAAVALGGYWKWDQTRQAEERERILTEQAEQQRVREVAERAERERQRIQEELRAQREAEEAARQAQIEAQQAEMKNKQFVEDTRPELRAPTRSTQFGDAYSAYSAYQQERSRQWQEQRERTEDQRAMARARAETERQKRYVESREREEEIARYRRDANARSTR